MIMSEEEEEDHLNSNNNISARTTLLWPDDVSRQQDRVFMLGPAPPQPDSDLTTAFINLLHDEDSTTSYAYKPRLVKDIPNMVYLSVGSKGHHWEVIADIQRTFDISTLQTFCFPSLRHEIKRKLQQLSMMKIREERKSQRSVKKRVSFQPVQLVVVEGIDRLAPSTIRQLDFIFGMTDLIGDKHGFVILFTMQSVPSSSQDPGGLPPQLHADEVDADEDDEDWKHWLQQQQQQQQQQQPAQHDEDEVLLLSTSPHSDTGVPDHGHHNNDDIPSNITTNLPANHDPHDHDHASSSSSSNNNNSPLQTLQHNLMKHFHHPQQHFNGHAFVGRIHRYALEDAAQPSSIQITPTTLCRHVREERDQLVRQQQYQKLFHKQFDGLVDFSTVLSLVSAAVLACFALRWLCRCAAAARQRDSVRLRYQDDVGKTQPTDVQGQEEEELTPEERRRREEAALATELLTQWRAEKKRRIVPDDDEDDNAGGDQWKTPLKSTRRKSDISAHATRRLSTTAAASSTVRKERTQRYAPLGMVSALKGCRGTSSSGGNSSNSANGTLHSSSAAIAEDLVAPQPRTPPIKTSHVASSATNDDNNNTTNTNTASNSKKPTTSSSSSSSAKKGKKTPSSSSSSKKKKEEEGESVHPMATRAKLHRTP